jgi:dipeptidyl aminopeptidase/acylaminoacyl peptidase
MRPRILALIVMLVFGPVGFGADELPVPPSIVTQGVPAISLEQARRFDPYQHSITVTFQGWYGDGKRRQMLVAKPGKILLVESPEAEPRPLNGFEGMTVGGLYPRPGREQFLATVDREGREIDQFYLADHRGGQPLLLTNGRSRHLFPRWSDSGNFLALCDGSSENQNLVLRLLDPSASPSKRSIRELIGGQIPGAWSPDDRRIAVIVNLMAAGRSNVVLVDVESGRGESVGTSIAYSSHRDSKRLIPMRWSSDGRALYWTALGRHGFAGLVRYELASRRETWLTPAIRWDVDEFDLSSDGRTIALIANEDGISKIHILDAETGQERDAPRLPMGRASGIAFRPGSTEFAFTLDTPTAPARVHSYDLADGRAERWATLKREERDPGAVDDVRLVRFPSFDGLEIPAFVYRPDHRFQAPFPVVVMLHGGPMEQVRAEYLKSSGYIVNELGIAVVCPNVRGSTGYGLLYEHLDDGANREAPIKDVGAVLDWIATQPDLDKDRVAVAGASYGGFLSLSALARYGSRLRAGIDICGVSDLSTLLARVSPRQQASALSEYGDVHDPDEAAFLHNLSPMARTSRINLPLLVVHGENDPRVSVSEAARLVAEVRKNGGPVWCVLGKGEGHTFTGAANVNYLIHAQNLFLYRYLGPARPARVEQPGRRIGR